MPKETFFRLPTEKREAILLAIRQELRRVSFDQLSVNRIIREAGIPRGSFYQYFEDREDLLAYVLEQIDALIREKLLRSLRESGGDIFRVFSDAFRHMLTILDQPEQADIFRNFFADFRPCGSRSGILLGSRIAQSTLDAVRQSVNTAPLRLRQEEDLTRMLEILQAVTLTAVADAFLHPEEADRIAAGFEPKLRLLREGFCLPSA